MKRYWKLSLAVTLLLGLGFGLMAQSQSPQKSSVTPHPKAAPRKAGENDRPDIVKAVKAAAQEDCGCGQCAAKGCSPCRGKNCYYCVAKALVAKDCGCSGCDAKGCAMCGPGCDVCKFHLAPNAASSPGTAAPAKHH